MSTSTLAGNKLIFNSNDGSITGLNLRPNDPTDAVSKHYVDSVATGLNLKQSVRVATKNHLDLNAILIPGSVVDGVTLNAGDRVLVKNQSSGYGNGVYIVHITPYRAPDFKTEDLNTGSSSLSNPDILQGAFVFVEEGTQQNTGWVVISDNPIDSSSNTSGVPSIIFSKFTGAGDNNTVTFNAHQTLTNKTLDQPNIIAPNITGPGFISGSFTGDITGNVTGNVTGTQDGVVGGNTPAAGTFTTITAGGTIDAGSNQVTNVTDPTANQHAATKAYVDSQLSGAANAINQLNSDVTVTDSGSNGLITFNIDGASEGTINSDGLTMGNINIDANTIKTTSGNLTIDPNPGGSGGTVTIEGSLTVTGTTTTVDSTVVTIADPVFQVGADSNDNLDRGITYLYNDGSAKKGYFGLDTSATEFVFIADATDTSSVFSGDLGAAAFGSMRVADLTNTRVTFSGANGELSDAASLTFNSGTGALSATSFVGALTGNVTGNSAGAHTGAVDGVVGGNTPAAVTGTLITANTNFVGDITGDLTGNSAGVHTGAVSGDVTSTGTSTFATVDVNGGAIDGAIIGANTAVAITGTTVNGTVITASTNFAGNITGNVTGNVAGNVTGTQDGVVGGNTPAAVTGTTITANGGFLSYSDRRLKKNFVNIENSLEKVNKINGYNFNWIKDDKEDVGVIAQEVEEVCPKIVHTGNDGIKKVDYSKLTPLLIEAIKELTTQVNTLKTELAELKAK